MNGLTLMIVFDNEETEVLNEVGIDYTLDNCDTLPMTFYSIDNIAPYYNDVNKQEEENYSSLCSGGRSYLVSMSIKELKLLVDKHFSEWNK